jgi:hypothetical protein
MKQSKFIAIGWPTALGIFLGILGYRVVVHQDFTGGIISGLIAVCLFLMVGGLIFWFRRNPE